MDCYYCHGNGEMECLHCTSKDNCHMCQGLRYTPCVRCNGSGNLEYAFDEQDSIANILQSVYVSPNFSRGR